MLCNVEPGVRGGHQMCIDCSEGKIYLLGGWNGTVELSDFWCYKIKEEKWELIEADTSLKGYFFHFFFLIILFI